MVKNNSLDMLKEARFGIWSKVFRREYFVDYTVLEKFIEKKIKALNNVKIIEKISPKNKFFLLSMDMKGPYLFKIMANMNGEAVVLDCNMMLHYKNREETLNITLTSPNFQGSLFCYKKFDSLIPDYQGLPSLGE